MSATLRNFMNPNPFMYQTPYDYYGMKPEFDYYGMKPEFMQRTTPNYALPPATPTFGHQTTLSLPSESPQEEDKPKRSRTAFTGMQLIDLEREFHKSMYMDRTRRIEISQRLCLTERKVKIWFQNRRMKHKRDLQNLNNSSEFQPDRSIATPTNSATTIGQNKMHHQNDHKNIVQRLMSYSQDSSTQSQIFQNPPICAVQRSFNIDSILGNHYGHYNNRSTTSNQKDDVKKSEFVPLSDVKKNEFVDLSNVKNEFDDLSNVNEFDDLSNINEFEDLSHVVKNELFDLSDIKKDEIDDLSVAKKNEFVDFDDVEKNDFDRVIEDIENLSNEEDSTFDPSYRYTFNMILQSINNGIEEPVIQQPTAAFAERPSFNVSWGQPSSAVK